MSLIPCKMKPKSDESPDTVNTFCRFCFWTVGVFVVLFAGLLALAYFS